MSDEKKIEKARKARQAEYKKAWDFYSEQLRRYYNAHPDWGTMPAEKGAKIFWGNYGKW